MRINNPNSISFSEDRRCLLLVGYWPVSTHLTQRHGRPLTTQSHGPRLPYWTLPDWDLRWGEIWPRPRVCYRRNNAPCTKANLNVSLHTVVLGMKQERDLFEQSSISICNHTPVCYDPINSHKPRDSGRPSSPQSKSMVPNTPRKTTTYFKVEGRKSDLLPTKRRAEKNSASINRRQSGIVDKSMSSGARWPGFSSRVCCFLACDLGQII